MKSKKSLKDKLLKTLERVENLKLIPEESHLNFIEESPIIEDNVIENKINNNNDNSLPNKNEENTLIQSNITDSPTKPTNLFEKFNVVEMENSNLDVKNLEILNKNEQEMIRKSDIFKLADSPEDEEIIKKLNERTEKLLTTGFNSTKVLKLNVFFLYFLYFYIFRLMLGLILRKKLKLMKMK